LTTRVGANGRGLATEVQSERERNRRYEVKFSQHIVVYASSEEALTDLMTAWQDDDAADAPGFLGGRLLRFRDKPGRYVIQADFETWEAAERNSERPQTQSWAARLAAVIEDEPKYENLDVLTEF